jgi:hypothetical protein
MKTCRLISSALAGALCAAVVVNAMAQEPAQQAPLRVYDATELTPNRYTVIKRVWVESWRSAFGIPAHADSSAAIAAISTEAARLGADAITNLSCLNDQRAWLDRGYFCYGLAIKLK